jgi:hypothetical protein
MVFGTGTGRTLVSTKRKRLSPAMVSMVAPMLIEVSRICSETYTTSLYAVVDSSHSATITSDALTPATSTASAWNCSRVRPFPVSTAALSMRTELPAGIVSSGGGWQ